MAIHLRQVCLVAETLESCQGNIEAAFQTPVCHRDPDVANFGLENALFAFGSQFLEVVAPVRDGTAAGRFLERKGGDGGYMVICQVPTLAEQADVRRRAEANQVRVAFESDHGSWNIMQLHPRDMGAAFLEVDWDEQADMQGNWQPAGGLTWTDKAGAGIVSAITGVELSGRDPQRLAEHWSQVTGLPVSSHNGHPAIHLANAVLRFSYGETFSDQGLTGVDVKAPEPTGILRRAAETGLPAGPDEFRLCGVQFNCLGAAPD
ncbi:VOC family protein [Marinobacter zhanjiangensis]|uniref:Glyoxalase-like domain-containing protein n=1 Tax=Marinobacter zhanjiangensis TaxID=578215 RepID=A0ABQ3B1K0_9GAMM|nr:VOC family protein [Marinobacter zhanjiangensis]GGY73344.1 hypothetical protein GCM10007071_20610 [Marinobacter zhanjiangensis]